MSELVTRYGTLSQRYIGPITQGKCVYHQLDYAGNFPDSTTFSHIPSDLSFKPSCGVHKAPCGFPKRVLLWPLSSWSLGLFLQGVQSLP